MVGVGRDVWRSPRPTPLLKQVCLGQVTQEGLKAGFEYLQRRFHSGQPFPVLCHPQSNDI